MRVSRNLHLAAGLVLLCAGTLTITAGGQTARNTQPGTVSATMPASPRVPVGITFSVRLLHDLDTRTVAEGTNWDGILMDDIVTPNGRVYIASGGTVTGVVAVVHAPSKELTASISLRAVSLDGVELQSVNETRGGTNSAGGPPPNGRITALNAQAAANGGPSGGFATAGNNGQEKIRAGAVLTFTTTAQ